MNIIDKLSEPLTKHDVELRVGMNTVKGFSLLLYKTARTDVKRLNAVCGLNWSNKHFYDANGLLCCTISLHDKESNIWVDRTDVGTESQTEKEKGSYSDSFKRAGFRWGIGLELYQSPFIFIRWEMENKKPVKFFAGNLKIEDYRVADGIPQVSISYSGRSIFNNIKG